MLGRKVILTLSNSINSNSMKIEIIGQDRLGITQEVLASLYDYSLDLAALEVISHHIYIDIPALTTESLPSIANRLLKIEGVQQIRQIDLLPDERRRLHLDALLSTLPDPVFAIDAKGKLLSANSAATQPLNVTEKQLIGRPAADILGNDIEDILNQADNSELGATEVSLAGNPYLLDIKPIRPHGNDAAIGSMLLLHAPPRLGTQIATVQQGEKAGFDSVVGTSALIEQAKERAQRFANINAPLLIQGETGTGKELFARSVHQSGPRHNAAFLALNCAALPENLVESELFGYASGAFSGAVRGGKPGLFELAEGGTVFLDEIGDNVTLCASKTIAFFTGRQLSQSRRKKRA